MDSIEITTTVPAKDKSQEMTHFGYYMPKGRVDYGPHGHIELSPEDKATIDEILSRNAGNVDRFKSKKENSKY